MAQVLHPVMPWLIEEHPSSNATQHSPRQRLRVWLVAPSDASCILDAVDDSPHAACRPILHQPAVWDAVQPRFDGLSVCHDPFLVVPSEALAKLIQKSVKTKSRTEGLEPSLMQSNASSRGRVLAGNHPTDQA